MSPKRISPLLAALLVTACADLALESDRVPTEIEILHDGGLLVEDETLQLDLVVRDQHGQEMPLPSWIPLVWEGTDATVAEVDADGVVRARGGGEVVISATLGDLGAGVRFRINPSQVVLSAPVIYLNQAVQGRDGEVRLIAGRPALLRVFMVGDRTSFYGPSAVRATLFQGETQVFQEVFAGTTDRTPREVEEGELDGSINGVIPGSVIQPGVTMVVELDPEGVIPRAQGSQTRYPAEGARELDVLRPRLFRQIIVPTLDAQSPNISVFNWTNGLNPDSPQLRLARTIFPIGSIEVEVAETYRSGVGLNTANGWLHWLSEMRVLYEQEGRRGYYYGVAAMSAPLFSGSSFMGIPVSVGLPSNVTYTHELGHNMNLWHAPCGDGTRNSDPNYPYQNGAIGIWGYDLRTERLLDPESHFDIMTYCSPNWISDYHFGRATDHRLYGDGGVLLDGSAAAADVRDRGEMLVVRGSVREGQLRLHPAFVVDGPPALPETAGPYRVEGLDAGGGTKFSLSFAPTPLEFGGGGFVFLVPWEADWADSLDRIVLSGPEGEYTLTGAGSPPTAVVTDPSTGRIRAIIRDWDGGPLPGEGTAKVTITRGVPRG